MTSSRHGGWGQAGRGQGSEHAALALRVLAVVMGVFFFFEAMGKLAWIGDSTILAERLQGYLQNANAAGRWYLETIAMPGVPAFARIVFLGELASGLALLAGFWTRLAAALAFVMVLNFHVASGALFEYSFLTNGYGLPVLSGLLALAIGGRNLPYSLTR
jgi:uncharacterized membrane protein YphA (DoxX/SURF4 family)